MDTPIQFTPIKNFSDADLCSDYCVGLNYTVRPGNEKLAKKFEKWLAAGLVRAGKADGSELAIARISGSGNVN